ncbi:MAG TPA: NfeD family protein [Ktedonobacteraceae bacterium]|nr:NfeD family protein [Ktedonobacteraceae bacterium]
MYARQASRQASRQISRRKVRGENHRASQKTHKPRLSRLLPMALISLVLAPGLLLSVAQSASAVSVASNSSVDVTLLNSGMDGLFALLTNPNVIFLLFILAIVGIYAEISHPGMILPGIVGAISLLLFMYGVGTLTPNWAGLALMLLSFALLVMDIYLPTHGVLTLGAVASLIFGSLLFFNSGGPYQEAQVNPLMVYGAGAFVGSLGLFIVSVVVRSRRKPVVTGPEGMLGARVIALTPLLPEGRVSYGGEDWAAVLDPPILTADAGSELRIVSVQGLRLHVQLATYLSSPVKPTSIEGA